MNARRLWAALALTVAFAGPTLSAVSAPAIADAHSRTTIVGYTKVDGVVYGIRADRRLVGPGRYQGLTNAQVSAHLAARARRVAAARPAPPAVGNAAAVRFALAQVGKPYVWGGTGPRGFDCSGLTSQAYLAAGKRIPRTSGAQRAAGRVIPRSQMQPGDLIWTPGHITMYVGGGKQVAARSPGTRIAVQPIWQRGYTVVRF